MAILGYAPEPVPLCWIPDYMFCPDHRCLAEHDLKDNNIIRPLKRGLWCHVKYDLSLKGVAEGVLPAAAGELPACRQGREG